MRFGPEPDIVISMDTNDIDNEWARRAVRSMWQKCLFALAAQFENLALRRGPP